MFEKLFNLSPDAIFVTDAQGRIRGNNLQAEEMFGYGPQELLGQPIEILVPERFRSGHPVKRDNYNAHPRLRAMGAGLNLFGLRKSGTELAVDIMLRPIESPQGPLVLSFIRDVSAQRTAQELLRRSDQQLRSIIDSVKDYAIFLLDPEGNVATWNPGAERIKGYSADEIIGRHFSIFYPDDELEQKKPHEELRIAAASGRFETEGWRIRKDGSRFWANIVITAIRDQHHDLTGFAKVTRDFTDRKRAEEALLLQLSSVLLANLDIRKMLSAISASIRDVVPHDCATLGLPDPVSGGLRVQFLEAGAGQPIGANTDTIVPLDNSPAGAAFRTREPVLLNRLNDSPFAVETMSHLAERHMQSGCWVPLVDQGKSVGTIAVASRTEAAFSQREVHMLGQLAGQIAKAVNNALAFRQIASLRDKLTQEKQYLEEELNLEHNFEDIVGESSGLKHVLKDVQTVAPTNATVLIQGETGTGKELLARAIHRLSPRRERTFIKLNCAAIPAGLLESELFGHEKGAFTGAIARKMGRLELAHEGTLFLDEIGELPLDLQPKLLRALQEREIERLGGTHSIPIDVRLVAATNRDLESLVAQHLFRSDLYYRLKVFPIVSPPLRDRRSDIPMLVRHFVDKHCRRMGRAISYIPQESMDALVRSNWPGNIRELENFIERSVILSRGTDLYVPLAELEMEEDTPQADELSSDPSLHTAEREHILRVLRETKGMIGGPDGAAERLGLKRTTLNSKLKKLHIERSDYM
ncbi:MAG: sigma 54-interacting transcriptional regulator [Acidobacteriaceae bacterium]|nr:sigma 54-interacting transcriptional regulator [Acidobacteriaceae bacterium]